MSNPTKSIPEQFAEFCQRIGATDQGCITNGGLRIQAWTGVFISTLSTETVLDSFAEFCMRIGATFSFIGLQGTTWTGVFTTAAG